MRFVTIALALTLTTTPLLAAKGSGGHAGGGHASGGHAGGSRSSGGHAATGHATARPRGGRVVVGTAVPRSSATPRFIPSRPAPVAPVLVRPYFVRPNFLGFGFGGLGSFYIPYGSWYDDPFYSYYGYPYSSLYSYPYTGPIGGGATTYSPLPFAIDDDDMGKLRLRVDQRLAQVYVDGYYAGIVDEFDGTFQHLDLTPGPHHIRIEQAGYAPMAFDVDIQPNRKIDYRARMTPAAPVQ